MIHNNMKYTVLLMLLASLTMASCIDDDFLCEENEIGIPEGFKEGYSLNIAVTLDNMGGTTRSIGDDYLKVWEDYIDPEKFRVLFFTTNKKTNEDLLLFESKSRWVKKLNDSDNRWIVSVPVFTYGNDVYDDGEWPWEDIRKYLTGEKGNQTFKIAILANRPEMEWYPGGLKSTNPDDAVWIDNTGPKWTPSDYLQKDVFDLHHCQYDPIYHGKAKINGWYDFIMDGWGTKWCDNLLANEKTPDNDNTYKNLKPQMGATSSWLDWNNPHATYRQTQNNTVLLNYIHPDATHPIPMYGIQEFNTIDPSMWQKGTPFNLSPDIPGGNQIGSGYEKKTIWLLRSVVKLELLIPKSLAPTKPDYVAMVYPNIYARCEPMDVWTPTNKLWNDQHDNDANCEINAIMKYRPVVQSGRTRDDTGLEFQKKMSWFYGVWKEKNWPFTNTHDFNPNGNHFASGPYPRIFNSCIQRNNVVICYESQYEEDKYVTFLNKKYNLPEDYPYWHYVVYTGERNINDPATVQRIENVGSGQPTVQYWVAHINGKLYGLPITDYGVKDNPALNITPQENGKTIVNALGKTQYINTLDQVNGSGTYGSDTEYMQDVANPNLPIEQLPWPLVRNHVYRITLSDSPIKTIYKWDFTKGLGATTDANLNADTENWEKDGSGYWYNLTVPDANEELKAGDKVIAETAGLKFDVKGNTKSINIFSDRLRLTKGETIITFPKMKNGQTITIVGKSADNKATDRGIAPTSACASSLVYQGSSDSKWQNNGYYMFLGSEAGGSGSCEFKWKVSTSSSAEVDVQFVLTPVGGIDFKTIIIEEPGTRGASSNGFKVKSEDFHTKRFE